ncbi:MAG: hypothetical protein WC824_07485 [Bacteroidota bacterium]|jgi:photosystem II stability/assembly factor-like uncharacterized protein
MRFTFALCIVLILSTSAAFSQWPDWERLPGPTGGIMQSFASVNNDIIAAPYLGAFYRSSDAGATWQYLFGAAWTRSTYALLGTADGMLFALGYSGTYRSSDAGASWTKCSVDDAALFAASAADGTVLLGLRGSVAVSSDKGGTWTQTVPTPGGTRDYKVAVDLAGNWYAGAYQTGLFRSGDHGQTWLPIDAGLPGNAIYSISVPAGDVVFAGLNNATFLSSDQGATWERINDLDNLNVYTVQHAGGNSMVAETSAGLYLSTDFGGSWETGSLAPYTAAFGTYAKRTGLMLFSANGRVMRSTDRGATFAISDEGLFLQNSTAIHVFENGFILTGNEAGGLYRSTDFGEHWEYATPGRWGYGVRALSGDSDSTMYMLTDDGELFRTRDEGTVWEALQDSVDGAFIQVIHFTDDAFYALSDDGRIFVHLIPDDTWDERGRITPQSGSLSTSTLAVVSTGNSIRLLAGTDRGLYISEGDRTTCGSTWNLALVDGLPRWFTEIAFPSPDATEGFAVSGDDIYQTTDRGDTWTAEPLDLHSPRQLTFNSDGDLFLIEEDLIHFYPRPLPPQPRVWQIFPALPYPGTSSLACVPRKALSYSGRLLAGSGTQGLFRSINSTLSAPAVHRAPAQFSITEMYPVPLVSTFDGGAVSLHLQLELRTAAPVAVEVCDMLGRILQRYDQGMFGAGSHDIRISLPSVASGALLLQVHGPGGMQQRILPALSAAR